MWVENKVNSLSFVPPVCCQGGEERCQEVDAAAKQWMNSVILYVVGDKPTIANHIAEAWNFVSKPEVDLHDEGDFLARFHSMDDRHEVLYSGPHTFFGKPMIVKAWTPEFHFQDEMLKVIPLWVRFPN